MLFTLIVCCCDFIFLLFVPVVPPDIPGVERVTSFVVVHSLVEGPFAVVSVEGEVLGVGGPRRGP